MNTNKPKDDDMIRKNALKAFEELRKQAGKNFPNGMTLEEINEEISKVRRGEPD